LCFKEVILTLKCTGDKLFFITHRTNVDEFKICFCVLDDRFKNLFLSQINSELSFVSKVVQIFDNSQVLWVLSLSHYPTDIIHANPGDLLVVNVNLKCGISLSKQSHQCDVSSVSHFENLVF
jgi:hypothetical protein